MRFAAEQDVDKLVRFLGRAYADGTNIEKIYRQFMLMEDEDGDIQAVIGYEKAGSAGLLRSLVLSPTVDKPRFLQFFQTFLGHIIEQNVENLYLVTNKKSALPLFHKFGFYTVEKDGVIDEIAELSHFKSCIGQPEAFILNCQLLTKLPTD
ncbi:MAG: mechanosensitive ion channel protein [Ectobacillus sp.]